MINLNKTMLSIIMCLQISSSLTFFAYIPLIALIADEMNLNGTKIGLISLAGAVGGVFFGLLSGWLVDHLKTRYIILSGPGLLTLSLFIFSISNEYWLVLVSVIFLGLAYGLILPLTNRLIAYYFSPDRMALVMGIKQSGSTIGQFLASLVVPSIAVLTSWRFSLQLVALEMLIAFLISYIYFYKKNTTTNNNTSHSKNLEVVTKKKQMRFLNFPRPVYLVLLMGFSMLAFQASITSFFIPFVLQYFKYSIMMAGFLLATMQISGAIFRPLLGWISDRFYRGERKTILMICCLANAILIDLLLFLPKPWVLLTFVILVVFGITSFGWVAVYFTYLVELFGKENSGIGTGYGVVANSLGAGIGPLLFGLLADHTSYKYAFIIFSLYLVLISFVFSTVSKRKKLIDK